ncbi:hypothetical protein [Mycolicibacterium sp.]|uniref:hypothetical protein n=1 Tax=Mycolicibacterium sp. TaxID=2320850 RepID=UPI0037C8239B
MKPGDAERLYDGMVLLGLNPVPWQFYLLAQMEQQAVNEQFRVIVAGVQKPAQQGR